MTPNEAKTLAVLEARFNSHEASCDSRMQEVRDTFVEVKDTIKTMRNLLATGMIVFAGTCLFMIAGIILKKIGLS